MCRTNAPRKSTLLWSPPASLYDDLNTEPLVKEFSARYATRYGIEPDPEAVEALAEEWLEGSLPDSRYLISPHSKTPCRRNSSWQAAGQSTKWHSCSTPSTTWNDTSLDWDGEDNYTNFTSIALNHAGMQVVNNSPPDQWSPAFTQFGGWVAAETSTPSWGAAQNLHDFLATYEGAHQLPLTQAKPGDVVFWQDDAGDGATPGSVAASTRPSSGRSSGEAGHRTDVNRGERRRSDGAGCVCE